MKKIILMEQNTKLREPYSFTARGKVIFLINGADQWINKWDPPASQI
jgi:hypothetical protein